MGCDSDAQLPALSVELNPAGMDGVGPDIAGIKPLRPDPLSSVSEGPGGDSDQSASRPGLPSPATTAASPARQDGCCASCASASQRVPATHYIFK
jgi:hypothetical protein